MSIKQSPDKLVEETFVALQGVRGLQQKSESQPVMFGELVHYVHGTANVDDERVSDALGTNLPLRRQFNKLIEQTRVASHPMQAQAASDELLNQRESRAFTLKFKTSRANDKQIFVLLVVHAESNLADGHLPVLLANKEHKIGRLCFPALKDQTAQLLLEHDDEKLVLMRDPDAELSLI